MLTVILSVLGGVVGAIIAALTVGWTVSVGWGVTGHSEFNPVALIFVAVGLALGALTAFLFNKMISAVKDNKNNQTYSVAEELNKLNNLLANGVITQAEFDEEKKKILRR